MMYWRNEMNDILSNYIFSFIFLCFVLQLITSSKPIFEAMVYGSWNTIWIACISPPSAVVEPRAAILFRCYGNGSRAFLLSIYLTVTSRQIFRGRVYAMTSPFPSYTPHVPAKPKTLSRQKCGWKNQFWFFKKSRFLIAECFILLCDIQLIKLKENVGYIQVYCNWLIHFFRLGFLNSQRSNVPLISKQWSFWHFGYTCRTEVLISRTIHYIRRSMLQVAYRNVLPSLLQFDLRQSNTLPSLQMK
jgi:hypothetical protein